MRKLFSIALTVLLLLNVMGYYAVFVGIQHHHEQSFLNGLDTGLYDEERSVTLKIPIAIPYLSNQDAFERVNGNFEHQGEFYRLVKQRYANDTLTIVCVRDVHNKRIKQALTDYLKTYTDTPGSDNSKTSFSFIKDYLQKDITITDGTQGWSVNIIASDRTACLTSSFLVSITHPPETV